LAFSISARQQADAMILIVDHKELLDPVAVEEPAGFLLRDILADHRHGSSSSSRTGCSMVPAKRRVAMREDADKLARLAGYAHSAADNHREAIDALRPHDRKRLAQRRIWRDRHRVHHDAAFEALHLPDFIGLVLGVRLRWMTPSPPSCAMAIASLASVTVSIAEEMIGRLRLMDRVIRLLRSVCDGRTSECRPHQHVVEGQRFGNGGRTVKGHANGSSERDQGYDRSGRWHEDDHQPE